MSIHFTNPARLSLANRPSLVSLYRRVRAILRPTPPSASASQRYLARAIEREFPRAGSGVALAVCCPDDDSFGAEMLLLQAQNLQVELECSVLVIDARPDVAQPGITQRLHLERRSGYADYLLDPGTSLDAIVQPSGLPDVWVVGQGESISSLVSVQRSAIDRLLAQAKERFDYTLVHVGAVTDDTRNLVVAVRADAVLLLAREHRTFMSALDASQEVLASNGVASVNVVLATE
jgi:hypothetical protein